MAGELSTLEPVRHPDRNHRIAVVVGHVILDVSLLAVEEDLEGLAGDRRLLSGLPAGMLGVSVTFPLPWKITPTSSDEAHAPAGSDTALPQPSPT